MSSDRGDRWDRGDAGELCVLGTATGLAGSWHGPGLPCLTSTGFAELVELGPVAEEDAVRLPDEGPGRCCGGLGRLAAPGGGWTAVPCAWVSDGSGGAATRWVCTGKAGFLMSRLTGRSFCECAGEDDDWLAGLDVEGLLPIFRLQIPGLRLLRVL